MFLSFIIPVYNCENLITRCVESIENQEFTDLEIILINDGSKDSSLTVIKRLSKEYDNIVIIDQDNKGASSARNAGLKIARGDYVWFVDADDYILDDIVRNLYECVSNNSCDIIAMNYKYITNETNTDIKQYKEDKNVSCVNFLSINPCMYAATKVYKKSTLISNGITFKEGLTNIEDFLFNIHVMTKVESIYTITSVGYVYDNTNTQSTSRNRDKNHLIRISDQSLEVHKDIKNLLQKLPENILKEIINKQLNYSITGHLFSLLRFYDTKRLKRVISWYKSNGLYPIGETGNHRAEKARFIFNNRWLLISLSWFKNFFSSK